MTQGLLGYKRTEEKYQSPLEKDGGCNPFDPPVQPKKKKIRLSKQAKQILAMLREGDATQRELMMVASQYNARIFEIRAAGHKIPKPKQNHTTGISVYHLEEE